MNSNKRSRLEFIHEKAYYSDTSKADRYRGVTYVNSRLHEVMRLCDKSAIINTLALEAKMNTTDYSSVKILLDECNKMTKIDLDYRKDSMFDSLVEQVFYWLQE
jgi:hypothetical protein